LKFHQGFILIQQDKASDMRGGGRGERIPAHYTENGSKDSCVVMFRDNKGMNCFENYKGNLEAPKNEVEC
jgi:hypothetical protein